MRALTAVSGSRPRSTEACTERGAVMIFVTGSLLVLIALSALTIDMGRNLAERRRLSSAIDAATLAAANAYRDGNSGCDGPATDFLNRNATQATLTGCQVFAADDGSGWVIVEANLEIDHFLAGMIGVADTTVTARSAAMFGPTGAPAGSGLRPFGMCLGSLGEIAAFQDWEAGDASADSEAIRLTYSSAHPDACGSTTGNWGFIDFDGGANSNSDIIGWIEDGYPGDVTAGWYAGSPGAISGSHSSALQSLVDSEVSFWVPLFSNANRNGANASFEITSFLTMRLVDFKTNGSQALRYIEFVVNPGLPETTCCGAGTGAGAQIALIAIDESGDPIGVGDSP